MKTKICPSCKIEKDRTTDNYYYNKDGTIRSYCISCTIAKKSAFDKARMPYILKRNREYCKQNPDKVKKWNRKRRETCYTEYMWREAKKRAEKRGVPFTIEIGDLVVPETCPVLNIPLFIGVGCACDNSPSLDAIVPEKGYTKENIAIISHRANSIKNDASASELRRVADWLEHRSTPA